VGQATAETVREIDETRRRLDGELRELEGYLPAAAVWAKRAIGVLVGGGIVTTALLFTLRRRRQRKGTRRLRDIEDRIERLERELGRP
jgi:uncharacterized membrane protein YhiD involved in acid resistance